MQVGTWKSFLTDPDELILDLVQIGRLEGLTEFEALDSAEGSFYSGEPRWQCYHGEMNG